MTKTLGHYDMCKIQVLCSVCAEAAIGDAGKRRQYATVDPRIVLERNLQDGHPTLLFKIPYSAAASLSIPSVAEASTTEQVDKQKGLLRVTSIEMQPMKRGMYATSNTNAAHSTRAQHA